VKATMKFADKEKLFKKIAVIPLSELVKKDSGDNRYYLHGDKRYLQLGTTGDMSKPPKWAIEEWDPKRERWFKFTHGGHTQYMALRLVIPKGKYKRERWTAVDYAVRCILTGDEEETRLTEDIPGWIKSFSSCKVSPSDLIALSNLMHKAKRVLGYGMENEAEAMLKILKKYVSHKAAWKDKTWEELYTAKLERE
jgi:hypothetical protein